MLIDKKTVDQEILELQPNPNIPNIWTDSISLAIRNDDVCVLRFSMNLPEGNFEQSRVVTNKEHLKGFVDILCSSLDYFPEKQAVKSKK